MYTEQYVTDLKRKKENVGQVLQRRDMHEQIKQRENNHHHHQLSSSGDMYI
jgi:hypothetical protein